MVEIDGSTLEGGGQILRTALALSVATKTPCHIYNIRKNRPQKGLKIQHLKTIEVLEKISHARTEGKNLGSEEIYFYPKKIQPKYLRVKMETAGSITLVLQGIIPISFFLPSPLEIKFEGGATDTFLAPTIDWYRYVFLKLLERSFGKSVIEIQIKKRGFYPQGGADMKTTLLPLSPRAISLTERGRIEKILIISGASENLRKRKVAERQLHSAKNLLKVLSVPIEEKIEYYPTLSSGSQINIVGIFEKTIIGVDNLGTREKSAEMVGQEAAKNFLKQGEKNAAVDKFAADQLLPFMALSGQKSKIRPTQISLHAKTNIWVIEKFLPGRFEVQNDSLIIWHPA